MFTDFKNLIKDCWFILILSVATIVMIGCSIKQTVDINLDKWHDNCRNAAEERQMYLKQAEMLQVVDLDQNPIARHKLAVLNELMLESDRMCGPNGKYNIFEKSGRG